MSNNSALNYLTDNQQGELREKGILSESEVAAKKGDIIVAINALNGNQRMLGYAKDIIKENKRILKG